MRSRNIKPQLFKEENLADAGPIVQLLFIGLWCMADREGLLEDRPRLIKAELFPYYDVDINGELTVMERLGHIRRYSVDGINIIQVINFKKHQSPHHTEKPTLLPSLTDNQFASYCKEKEIKVTVNPPLNNGDLTVKPPLINESVTVDTQPYNESITTNTKRGNNGAVLGQKNRRSDDLANSEIDAENTQTDSVSNCKTIEKNHNGELTVKPPLTNESVTVDIPLIPDSLIPDSRDVVVVVAREKKVFEKSGDPKDAMEWVEFFMNKMGFQFHEAQTAKTMPMFHDWVARGVTIADVELAHIQVNHVLDGERSSYPTYYKKFVDTVLLEKQRKKSRNPPGKVNGSDPLSNHGEDYGTQRSNNETHAATGKKLTAVEQQKQAERAYWEKQQRERGDNARPVN